MNYLIITFIIFIIFILLLLLIYFKLYNKKIAIISTIPHHIECVGYILEYLDDYNIDIYIDKDKVNYLDYFKTIYKFNHYHINNFDETKYDTIIKLTSLDPYNINKKHFSILHVLGDDYYINKYMSFITLTPFVKSIYDYKYILSIYKDYINTNSLNKNISFIGRFQKKLVKNTNDIINLIDNINGKLMCFGYNSTDYNNNRIINYNKISTIDMVEKLKQCSYIIIKEHDDRYSGGITTALSLNIPLIMKKSIADNYNIPAITYHNNINEVSNNINNMNLDDYMKIKNNLRDFTDKQIKINKNIFKNLIKNNQSI